MWIFPWRNLDLGAFSEHQRRDALQIVLMLGRWAGSVSVTVDLSTTLTAQPQRMPTDSRLVPPDPA